MREDIKKFIQVQAVCVLATVSGGDPHCSFMSYASDDDCREIYMATKKNTKKYRNLKDNPAVSLLIDSRESGGTDRKDRTKALTVTGIVQTISDEDRKATIRARLLNRHPDLQEFFGQPDTAVLVVRVKALQLLDGITDAYYETVA